MEKLDEIFISRVRSIIKERKIKQIDLAKKVDITPQHLSKVMRGRKPLPKGLERAIAKELGIESEPASPVPIGKEMVKAAVAEVLDERASDLEIDEERLLWLFGNDDHFRRGIHDLFEGRLAFNENKMPLRLRRRS